MSKKKSFRYIKRNQRIKKKDLENLIFVYENCNILNAKSIRKSLKPTIDKIYEMFYHE